jgi:methylglutaconyl-CoA hydratase
MRFKTIRVEADAEGIATVTLDRPDKHHAMNAAMIAELTEAAAMLGVDSRSAPWCWPPTAELLREWMRAQAAADLAARLPRPGGSRRCWRR